MSESEMHYPEPTDAAQQVETQTLTVRRRKKLPLGRRLPGHVERAEKESVER